MQFRILSQLTLAGMLYVPLWHIWYYTCSVKIWLKGLLSSHVYIQTTGIIPLSYHPNNPSPLRISHYGCWTTPHWHLNSSLRGSHIYWTPWNSVRPELDPQPQWSTLSLGSDLCPKHQRSSASCSSIFTWSPPCRTFQPDKDTPPSPVTLLLAGTSCLCQGLLQIVYYLFPHQTCVPQTLQTSQATSNPQEALEFYLHGFHREASPFFGLHSILVIVDHCQEWVFWPDQSAYRSGLIEKRHHEWASGEGSQRGLSWKRTSSDGCVSKRGD